MRRAWTVVAIFVFALFGAGGWAATANAAQRETAIFAGGCFWCVESDFDHVKGVISTVSGFTGGTVANPTYRQVSHGGTGHYESVEITFDPGRVSYEQLLTAFWHSVDPTDGGGQFCDRGPTYRTAIFATSKAQYDLAIASKKAAESELGRSVATAVKMAGPFYPAETYHQNYYQKHPIRYNYYRLTCGRNQRVDQVWGAKAYLGINH